MPGIGNDVDIPNGSGFIVDIAAAASASTLALGADATLNLTGASLTLANDSTLDGVVDVSGGTFDLGGATVTLTNTLSWSNTSTIANGTLNLPASAQFQITAGVTNTLSAITVNINGDTTYGGGNLTLANGSQLNTNAVFDFADDVGIVDGGGTPSGFTAGNGSTVVKSFGALTSAIDSTLISSVNGSVVVQTGTLDLNIGTLNLGPGDVFSGNGTLIGNVTNNGGIIRPGGANTRGTLTINGTYINLAGTLEIEIDGAATNDVFAVATAANYSAADPASILDISYIGGFIPTVAETHNVITCVSTCDTLSSFGTVNQPTGVTHSVNYNATNLNLTVTSVSFFWDGGGDGVTWFDLDNWSLDVLPNAGTDVVLTNGDNVIFDGGSATVASLTLDIGSSLDIASGALTNGGLLTVNGGATLGISGGTLDNGGDTSLDGNFFISTGGIATFRGNAVFNGGYSNNGGTATFTGTAAFNGSNTHAGGTTTFNSTSSFAGATQITGGAVVFNAVGTLLNLNNSWSGGTITGAAGPNLVLGVVPGDTTLAINGGANKTLDTITLDMNLNDINMSGSGNLVLASGAVIDNTGGQTFNHSGSGGIVGAGTFINNGGAFNNNDGSTLIAVDFQNDIASTVNVSGGALLLNDADAGDLGTYNVGSNGSLVFQQDRNLLGTLNVAGTAVVGNDVTLTLPANVNLSGGLLLNAASQATVPTTVLDLSALSGSTLVLGSGASLGGAGTVNGNVVNGSGVLVVGGAGALGTLDITGDYSQGSGSAMVVDVFNNGTSTVSDQLVVNGSTALNGGSLVIGFTTNSLGIVTADFSPFQFNGGASGNFTRIFDAGGNILLVSFNNGVFTVLGVSPKVPDSVIGDLVSFIDDAATIEEIIASNASQAELVMEELLAEQEAEEGSLVCN